MLLEFGPRLNLLTGDNGLGKTFALDLAWWTLTRTWAGLPAMPRRDSKGEATDRIPHLEQDEEDRRPDRSIRSPDAGVGTASGQTTNARLSDVRAD